MIVIPPLDQHVHRFIINYKPERGPDVYVKTVTTFGDRPEPIMAVTVMRKLQRWFKRATQRLLKQLQRMIMSMTFLTRSKTRKKPKHQSRRQNTRAWTARHHWMCRRANTVGFAACCRTQTQWWSSSVRRHAPSKWSHSAWTSSNSYSGRDTPGASWCDSILETWSPPGISSNWIKTTITSNHYLCKYPSRLVKKGVKKG